MRANLEAARALHDEVVAIDLHADTPKLMHAFDYDLMRRHEPPLPRAAYLGHVDLPRMREGGLGGQFFGLWTFPYPRAGCAASVARQIDALEASCARGPAELSLCRTADDVVAARANRRIAALTGIEGGHALEGRIENLAGFARRGVRYLGLVHFTANDLGRPQKGLGRDDSAGLTPFGREVILAMNQLGMLVDLAHINRKGFFEALETSKAPVIVSHTGVASVAAHWRNIDDEQVRAVAKRGGVIGIIFAPRYLGRDGVEAVADHICHVVKVGGQDVAALGSDYDGMVRPPEGLEDVSRLPRLTLALLDRGLSRETVKKVLGENVLRVLRDVPPASA